MFAGHTGTTQFTLLQFMPSSLLLYKVGFRSTNHFCRGAVLIVHTILLFPAWRRIAGLDTFDW
jgi:hypothetical protein